MSKNETVCDFLDRHDPKSDTKYNISVRFANKTPTSDRSLCCTVFVSKWRAKSDVEAKTKRQKQRHAAQRAVQTRKRMVHEPVSFQQIASFSAMLREKAHLFCRATISAMENYDASGKTAFKCDGGATSKGGDEANLDTDGKAIEYETASASTADEKTNDNGIIGRHSCCAALHSVLSALDDCESLNLEALPMPSVSCLTYVATLSTPFRVRDQVSNHQFEPIATALGVHENVIFDRSDRYQHDRCQHANISEKTLARLDCALASPLAKVESIVCWQPNWWRPSPGVHFRAWEQPRLNNFVQSITKAIDQHTRFRPSRIVFDSLDATEKALFPFVSALANSSVEKASRLLTLHIVKCVISQKVLDKLGEFIAGESCRLRQLEIRNNTNDSFDFAPFARAVAANKTLTTLHVEKMNFGENVFIFLTDLLSRNTVLRVLRFVNATGRDVGNAFFSDAVIIDLLRSIVENPSLCEISLLSTLDFTCKQFDFLAQNLQKSNFTLHTVDPDNAAEFDPVHGFYSKNRILFLNALRRNRCIAWRKTVHDRLIEFCIALLPLGLLPYILLEIFDWLPHSHFLDIEESVDADYCNLPQLYRANRYRKMRLIESCFAFTNAKLYE